VLKLYKSIDYAASQVPASTVDGQRPGMYTAELMRMYEHMQVMSSSAYHNWVPATLKDAEMMTH
jgi:hypothetical protein